jgi:hypothetical protein
MMPNRLRSIDERFWSKVARSGGCWVWLAGKRGTDGYGGFHVAGRDVYAHRWAWE